MKNEKQTSNLNFNVQLFWKSENHLFWCFLSQLQYKNENPNFISNFISEFIKKAKWYFGYTDWYEPHEVSGEVSEDGKSDNDNF